MSASNKKKLRKEDFDAKLTERQQAQQKEDKQLKIGTTVFVVAIALIFVVGLVMMGYNWYSTSGLRDRWTTAVELGEHKLTVAEFNYYYVDMINELTQDWYSMYLLTSEEGLDSSKSLDDQLYHGEEGRTWGDYFIDKTVEEISGILSLVDAAKTDGYTLTAEETATIEDTLLAMETQGLLYGYGKIDEFLQAIYGHGASAKTYKAYVENLTLAQSYYNHYTEGLTFTEEQKAEQEKETGSYSAFTYTYFNVNPEDFIEHEGTTEHEHSEEELKAALETAKAVAEKLAASGATTKEELDAEIAKLPEYNPNATEATEETAEETTESTEETTEATTEATEETTAPTETTEATEATGETTEATGETTEATEPTGETEEETTPETVSTPTSTKHEQYDYYSINSAIGEWLISGEHKDGDIAAIPYYALDEEENKTDTIESYYVVIFHEEDKREEKLLAVRHILINYQGGTTDEETGEMVYSDEQKQKAEDKINEIKAEWEAGAKTEDSFGELAKKYTEDSNGADGGLYDEVYPGWAVENFDAWCYDESRKSGDVGVVHTEYGCHLIYYVGEQEMTYRELLVDTDLRAAASEEWYVGLRDALKNTAKKGDTSAINTDIVLAG